MTKPLASRLFAAGLLTAIAASVGCENTTTPPEEETGVTQVLLTDAPFPFDRVSRVDVYVVRVDASAQVDTTASVTWTNIVSPMQTFNLLELQRGTTAFVGAGDLPAGQYAAVRMVIDTDQSSITMSDGTLASVRWPVQGELALHAIVEEPFQVAPSGSSIVIDFDVGRSFYYQGATQDSVGNTTPEGFVFLPVIRAVTEGTTGAIVGTVVADTDGDGVTEPIAAATVNVQRVDRLALYTGWLSSGSTDAAGTFRIDFLVPGIYRVEAQPPAGLDLGVASVGDAVVAVDETTQVDLTLASSPAVSLDLLAPGELDVGATASLTAILLDANGDTLTNQPVVWSFGPATVIDVTAPGGGGPSTENAVLTAVGPGLGSILVESAGLLDSVGVLVRDPNAAPVETVELTPVNASMAVYDTVGFAVTLRDAAGNTLQNRVVNWSVRDSTVLAFNHVTSSTASVVAVAVGTATVSAASEGKTGSATVTVH